jgi:outer membrane lipoprotein-sorting protein
LNTTAPILVLALAAISPLCAADEAALPSVDQILAKYVAAAGGKETLEKINTRVIKGTIDVVTFNVSGAFEQSNKAPNQQVMTSEIPGYGTVIQCFDGKAAWASDPEHGVHDVIGSELARMKRSADIAGQLHMKEAYKRLTVKEKSKAGDREAYVVEAEPAEGNAEKLYFDAQTGLLIRVETRTPDNTAVALTFDDYKDVDGIKVPFTIKQDSEQLSLVIKAQDVKNNVPVDDARFVKPAAK